MPEFTVIPTTKGRPTGSEPCDLCGSPTVEIKCKVICKNCGYTRDCSDP